MGWVYRKKFDHVCGKPAGSKDVSIGDIWQCDCGQLWRVKRKGFDQRDNNSWSEWEVYDGPVPQQKTGYAVHKLATPGEGPDDTSGIYAPGTK